MSDKVANERQDTVEQQWTARDDGYCQQISQQSSSRSFRHALYCKSAAHSVPGVVFQGCIRSFLLWSLDARPASWNYIALWLQSTQLNIVVLSGCLRCASFKLSTCYARHRPCYGAKL